MIDQHVNFLSKHLNEKPLSDYFSGFKPVAYAFYDENQVFLFLHPKFPKDQGKPHILPWNEQFIGSTIILFEEYPTAIVGLQGEVDVQKLYAYIVHEMFHGYQYLAGEKRFPNEMMGINYPLMKENIALRNIERDHLYEALMTSDAEERLRHIQQFQSFRDKRGKVLGEAFLAYETAIETVEGPALYIEMKAFAYSSGQAEGKVLLEYSDYLTNRLEASLNLRKGCYGSGMFICLLLDQLYPNWHDEFMQSPKSLYAFFKEVISIDSTDIDDVEIDEETVEIITRVAGQREAAFEQFAGQEGVHLFIKGKIFSKIIDPMNISRSGNKMLHRNFVQLGFGDEEFLFQQPVVTYSHEGTRESYQIHTILNEEPKILEDAILINGIGEIKGKVTMQDGIITVQLSNT